MQATIFDIQNLSLNDGPGIRTAIFFKGCPLNCIWCHNPESNSSKPQIMFHKKLCVNCMKCIDVCKNGVHKKVLENNTYKHVVDTSLCTGCGDCLSVCCYDAISIVGKKMTTQEVFEKIEKDFRYYNLGLEKDKLFGGVTFSGGEPLLNVDFIIELKKMMPNIHCAMETCGFSTKENLEKVLPSIDLFLFDYKVTNSIKHKELCGVDNSLILSNLDFIYNSGKEIVLRLPMIPGLNDTPDHFDGIAQLLKKYPKIKKAEIMPYHTYGLGKFEELGLEYSNLIPTVSASEEDISKWLSEFKIRGCTNIFRS